VTCCSLKLRLIFNFTISHWIVVSGVSICYLYVMPLLRIKLTLLGSTNCSLLTKLVMLTQLPLLASSWIVFPASFNGKTLHVTAFISHNTYHPPATSDKQFENPTGVCKWTVGLLILTNFYDLSNHFVSLQRHWQVCEKRLFTSLVESSGAPVLLCLRLEELGSNRTNVHKILYFNTSKICFQIQVWMYL